MSRRWSPLLACALLSCSPSDPDALVRVDTLDGGDDCPGGGVAIHTGLDYDSDGTLDDAEIADSSFACNGTNGTNGDNGDNGDDGDDGEPGEPGTPGQHGDDGVAALVRVDLLDPGEGDCEFGGVAIHVGVDNGAGGLAGDGLLDDTEIDDTAYVCHGADGGSVLPEVIEGDVSIMNTLDVALLAQAREVTGLVTIASGSLTTATFPALETVGGLSIQGQALASFRAPLLQTVTGQLYVNVGFLPQLHTLELPVLTSVGTFRAYSGSDDPRGEAVDDWSAFDSIATITGDMIFGGSGSAPADLSGFSALTTIGGKLTIDDQGFGMTKLSGLAALETLGSLELDSSGIVHLGEWDGVHVTGDVIVRNSYFIEDFGTLGGLASIGGNLRLDGNYVDQCDARAVIAGIGRENVGGYVEIDRNFAEGPCASASETPVGSFTVSALVGATGLAFDGQYLWALTPATNQIHKVDFAGNVLGSVAVPADTSGLAVANGDLWIGNTANGTVQRLDWDGTVLDSEAFAYASTSALGGDSRYLFGVQSDGESFTFLDLVDGGSQTRSSSLDHLTAVVPVRDERVWLLDGVDDVLVRSFNSGGEQIVAGVPGPVLTLAWDGVDMWGLDPATGTIALYALP